MLASLLMAAAIPGAPTTTSSGTTSPNAAGSSSSIALGESIVVTGATAANHGLTFPVVICLVLAFLDTVALWWLYFGGPTEDAHAAVTGGENPGRVARDAYTYVHLLIIAGIMATAAGDNLLIANLDEPLHGVGLAVVLGGPALFLLGQNLFAWMTIGTANLERLAAAGAIVGLVPLGTQISAVVLAAAVTALLGALAFWELRGSGYADRRAARNGVESRPGESGKLAEPVGVLGGEVGARRLVGQLQEAVVAAILPVDRAGQPSAEWRVGRGLGTEGRPGGMGFDLGLGQPHHLARRQVQAVKPAAARIYAVVAPALVALAEVEELARGVAVAVEVDLEGRLLGRGQRASNMASAMQQVVEPRRQFRIVCDLGSDLGAHITRVRHAQSRSEASCSSKRAIASR